MGIKLSKEGTNPTKCFLDLLPDPIIAEIISRLPIRSILGCMRVCKAWLHLISSNHFNNFLFEKRSSRVTFILYASGPKYYFCEIEHPTNHTKALGPIKPMMLETKSGHPYSSFLRVIGICNGLICVLGSREVIYIWNPILGQYIAYPMNTRNRGLVLGCGFGYCQFTSQYKVLVIVKRTIYNKGFVKVKQYIDAEVLTIGPNTWRNAGKIEGLPVHRNGFCCLKGTIHWICECDDDSHSKRICCFDVGTEQQRYISPPPHFNDDKYMSLYVVWDCLCIFIYNPREIVLWSMKDYGVAESWTKHIFIDRSCFFRPEASIKFVTTLWDDKEILLLEFFGYMAYYDCNERQFVKLKTTIDDCGIDVCYGYPYFPSFVSLYQVTKKEPSKMVITKRDAGCFAFLLPILRSYI